MKLSSPALDDVHALKCEMAAEVLRSCGTLRLRAAGRSMLPAIWPGDTLVVEQASGGDVSEGDIVLFSRNGRFVAHRVVTKIASSVTPEIQTQGDATPQPDLPVSESDLLGKVSVILRNGKGIEPSRRLRLSQRAISVVIRRSEIAARVVVGMHGLREALLRPAPRVTHPRNREVACQN